VSVVVGLELALGQLPDLAWANDRTSSI
jgi:hypothetical protein